MAENKWITGVMNLLIGVIALFITIVKVIFFTLYHGESPFFTTIWGICFCSKHLKQIQEYVNVWLTFSSLFFQESLKIPSNSPTLVFQNPPNTL